MNTIESNSCIKICTKCGGKSPDVEFHKRATQCKICRHELMSELYKTNKESFQMNNRLNIEQMHDIIFSILGNECVICHEIERELLTVDHINNDRKSEISYQSHVWKRQIIAGTVDRLKYQILCRNCNESKYRQNPIQLLSNKPLIGILQLCLKCNIERDISEFYSRGVKSRIECAYCFKNKQREIVINCYKLLGGKCACCGINDYFKLQIDHVNNDGAVRRQNGEKTGLSICRKIIIGEVNQCDFQLLCANCNYSKLVHHGICIHMIQRRNVA